MGWNYSKNKFSQLLVEVPLEFRWRTSTYEAHKFWRIYGGLKCSYLVYDKSVFNSGTSNTVIAGNKDFNKLTYGAYISSGYNTLNVYAYYGLNPIFKSAKTSTENLAMKSFNFGIIFCGHCTQLQEINIATRISQQSIGFLFSFGLSTSPS